ncbi:MAG: conjugal transfer protein TrbE [Emcibacter sp.]|nr:conjugal transfer protein TrbE [Emcibacter sp.]
MFHLNEYQSKSKRLQDHIPWAGLVTSSVILNKDGGFMRCIRLRGPDLESSGAGSLVALHARLNDMLRRFGSGWAMFFDSERIPVTDYLNSDFADPVSALIEEERRAQFEGGDHFENITTLSLFWLPPEDRTQGFSQLFLEQGTEDKKSHNRILDQFIAQTDKAIGLLTEILPEVVILQQGELLTYLHGTISNSHHPVKLPDTPFYLDGLLTDEPLLGGLSPMLGDQHIKLVTITGFPGVTVPGILQGLNSLGFEYRYMSRFLCLDKVAATKELTKYRRLWFAKRKGIGSILKEVMTNEQSVLVDTDAENKSLDVDVALQELGSDDVAFGYVTLTIQVKDSDPEIAEAKIKAVEQVINGTGFVTIRETVNAVEAWLGMIPAHVYANLRHSLVSTLNLAHMLPVGDLWAGPEENQHLGAPPLMICQTASTTPFRFVHHVGDVGHMMVLGPTGAGKSVFLSFLMVQFRRYEEAQIFIFDKGASSRAAILAMGGDFNDLGQSDDLSFQPLFRIDDEAYRIWAQDWLQGILSEQGFPITPQTREELWQALDNLSSAPEVERTLTGLSLLLQNPNIKEALKPYTLEGPYGGLLDGDADHLALTDCQAFEMEALMEKPGAVLPVLTYLFKRLEERFEGRPTLLILDEAWLFLDTPAFAGKIREWLKVLRKKNVSVIFATQSLADIAGSAIAPALIESCPSRIFLPNVRAEEPNIRSIYAAFGLSDQQIHLIAHSLPKRDYYLQSPMGNRLFELGLGPLALSIVAASSPEDQKHITEILSRHPKSEFAAHWLRAQGMDWAVDLITKAKEEAYA